MGAGLVVVVVEEEEGLLPLICVTVASAACWASFVECRVVREEGDDTPQALLTSTSKHCHTCKQTHTQTDAPSHRPPPAVGVHIQINVSNTAIIHAHRQAQTQTPHRIAHLQQLQTPPVIHAHRQAQTQTPHRIAHLQQLREGLDAADQVPQGLGRRGLDVQDDGRLWALHLHVLGVDRAGGGGRAVRADEALAD